MHSSPTLTTPTVPFLVQAGFCATGLVLGLLSYHTFSQPGPAFEPSPEEISPARVAPPARPPALTRSGMPPAATASTSATRDSNTALAEVREILGSCRSEERRLAKLAVWAERATEAELKLALELPPAPETEISSPMLERVVFGRLAEIDGDMALQVFHGLERNAEREIDHDALDSLFETWASWDPQGAARGALGLLQESPGRFAVAVQSVLGSISREFPLYARDLATQLARSEDESVRDLGFEAHADLLRQHLGRGNDYASAVEWINRTQVSAEERQFLLGALVTQGLNDDHVTDALRIFRQVDAAANPELTMRLIRTLADTDPQTSREMTLALPPGELRAEAASTMTRILLKTESPEAVLTWLRAQSTHADFDQAFVQLAEAFDGRDPHAAWNCAARVSTEAERKANLTYEFSFKWLKADFAQAALEVPADLVQKYQRTEMLLREFGAVFPDSNDEFSVNFRPAKQRGR